MSRTLQRFFLITLKNQHCYLAIKLDNLKIFVKFLSRESSEGKFEGQNIISNVETLVVNKCNNFSKEIFGTAFAS